MALSAAATISITLSLQIGSLSAIQLKKESAGGGQLTDSIAVEIQFVLNALPVNGVLQVVNLRRPVRSDLVWIYIARHGRYILSFAPRPHLAFVKAGRIRSIRGEFLIGGDKIEFESAAVLPPAVPEQDLYVLHDADFEPVRTAERDQVLTGTVGAKEIAQSIRR